MNRKTLVVMSIVVLSALFTGALSASAFSFGKYEKTKASGDAVTVQISRLSDGKAHFFKYSDSGKEIAFFAVKAADGGYRTAFDACDACYKSKKGYEQAGDRMNCKNCNQKFAIAKLGPNATGGCNPGYLPNQLSGDRIIIKLSDLKAGARYF